MPAVHAANGTAAYFTVRAKEVEWVVAVIPLLDWAETITV
jgi:hypothetical protein